MRLRDGGTLREQDHRSVGLRRLRDRGVRRARRVPRPPLRGARRPDRRPVHHPDPRRPPGVRLLPRGERAARGDTRRARPGPRGEGPLHGRPRRPGRPVRRLHRRRARLLAGTPAPPPRRGAHARHREAHRLEPAPQQAGPPDPLGVRAGAPARGHQRAARAAHRGASAVRRRDRRRDARRPGPAREPHHPRRRRVRRHDLDARLPPSDDPGDGDRRAARQQREPVRLAAAWTRWSGCSIAGTSATAPASRSRRRVRQFKVRPPIVGVGSAGLGDLAPEPDRAAAGTPRIA